MSFRVNTARAAGRDAASSAAAAGRRMVTDAPRGAALAIATVPPCSSTIFFTIARPSPVPLGLGVT
jgi:hypothetical protein